jgi:FkbM family methyltransferase
LRDLLALAFRSLFKIKSLRSRYFGFYKRLFKPFRLFRGVRKRVEYRKGIWLDLDIDDWIQQNLYFLDEYEEREKRFVEQYLKEGDVFVDLGSNIGLYSLVASRVVGAQGKVYAFEPGRESFAALSHHIELNQAKNITAEKMAVADSEGLMTLHIDEMDHNKGGASAYPAQYSQRETVTTTSLDAYFARKGITSVALVKMDIEGGEYLALKGMSGILKIYKPALLLELDPEILGRTPYRQAEIEGFLQDLGYKKYYLNGQGEIEQENESHSRSTNYVFIAALR